MSDSDLFFQMVISGNDEDILKCYIDKVANKNLRAYQEIIQTGAKSGESLYAHVLNGIFVLDRLRPILDLEDLEVQILFTAYSIHDLNKLPHLPRASFNKLATIDNITNLLKELEINLFFPEYTDYLEEIKTLIRAHSGHYHTFAETLQKDRSPYQLSKQRVEDFLVPIIQAMDVIDLSKSLDEKAKKAGFLGYINSICDKQYCFVSHKLFEHRGIVTNLIHNQVTTYLEEQKNLIPLLFYPEGVAYLVRRDQDIHMEGQDWAELRQRIVASAEKLTADDFEKFIEAKPAGIKIDEKCIALGLPCGQIFNEVRNKISDRSYIDKVNQINQKCLQRLEATRAKLEEGSDHFEQIQQIIDQESFLLPVDDDVIRLGEFVRTYYSFLNSHFKKEISDAWEHIYSLLGLNDPDQYTHYDKLYNRAYIVGKDLALRDVTFDQAYDLIVEDGEQILSQVEIESEFTILADYLEEQIDFSFETKGANLFTSGLSAYVDNNHKQCSSCGSQFKTDKWMKADVPANFKVQYFSNRLEGGSAREPKRMICQVCRVQYVIDKLCYRMLGNTKTFYAHLYPCSFFTSSFLHAFRSALDRLKQPGFEAILLKTDQVFRHLREDSFLRLSYSATKVNGNPLPQFSEAIGNILTIPINAPGDNDTDKMLFALSNALIYQRFLGCRIVLTESSIPIFTGNDFNHLFIDNLGIAFQGIIPHSDLNSTETQALFERMILLYEIKSQIGILDSRDFIKLIRSIGEHPLAIYHVAHTLIRKKDEKFRLRNIRQTASVIEKLALEQGGKQIMSHIKELAQIGWQGGLRGDSLKDNSLAKALDIAFDCMDRWKPEWETEEEAIAIMSKEIGRAIERISGKYFGQQKLMQIDRFVSIFFESIYKQVYKGNVFDLIGNHKRIRAAYLYFISQQIGQKDQEEE